MLKLKVKKCKYLTLGDVLSKLVQLKRITDVGMRAEPPAAGRFFVIFWNKKLF